MSEQATRRDNKVKSKINAAHLLPNLSIDYAQ